MPKMAQTPLRESTSSEGLVGDTVAFARKPRYAADARDVAGGHAEGARTPLAQSESLLPITRAGTALGRVGLKITCAC